jgi:transcriptional regulator with XRE-family HTH domain
MSLRKQIRKALVEAGFTQAQLAKKLHTTPQNLSLKLKREKFPQEYLEKIASAIGAKYQGFFCFPDGTKI